MTLYVSVISRGIELRSVIDLACLSSCASSLDVSVSCECHVVVGYFKGQFNLEEIDDFMSSVALS